MVQHALLPSTATWGTCSGAAVSTGDAPSTVGGCVGAIEAAHSTNPGGHPKEPPRSTKSKHVWCSLVQIPAPKRTVHDVHGISGVPVGGAVGAPVGVVVVGCVVGACVLGVVVGTLDGTVLGAPVGAPVGVFVGIMLGSRDGA